MEDAAVENLTIVGIGSSAGGLEAVRELVSSLPKDVPVTYVVVQHMSPHHKSLMTELVARQTNLNVANITDGLVPEANSIYITPPRTDVILEGGKLRLVPPSELAAAPKPSVDRFLLSLADDIGERAMGIILSGTGSDGAYGMQAIREAGGITIAQDKDSAKYNGMPLAAANTGCIDLILRPEEIGLHLRKIISSARDFSDFKSTTLADSPVSSLLQVLLARTRIDFRDYKQSTVNRRIERRMVALGIDDLDEYTQFLRANPSAVDSLFKDLLISVTRFFRDKDEFASLAQRLPELIKAKRDGPLRIWVAGCATGEEAYSIAMLLTEALGGQEGRIKDKLQVFATDIDKDALQIARKGIYTTAALNDIPTELAQKYMTRHGDGIRVNDVLRSVVLFSDHNVCQDPPFQRVDLLCCRNLLIYFDTSLQQKVMSRFHYALSADALLFLGMAETVAGSEDLFAPEEGSKHLFRKRTLIKGNKTYRMPTPGTFRRRATQDVKADQNSTDAHFFEALMTTLGQNSILVTADGSILRVHGTISPFIEVSSDTKLSMHLDLLKRPLRDEARSLVAIALKNAEMRNGIHHRLADFPNEEVFIKVYPIDASKINEKVALIVFERAPISIQVDTRPNIDVNVEVEVANRIADLENEVSLTREALQQTIEELETSNEELQSLNEELQSTNEELQATNEELETSNEELQSTNEELITVNEELQITATELSGRTGELMSVLQSTPLAIVVTDNALQITQITNAASELFNISHPVQSPHISQCSLPSGYPQLGPICNEALKLGTTMSHEFNSEGARVILSCTPYFDTHGKILGLTMVITEFPGLAREMELILDTSKVHLMNRTIDGRILQISAASAETLGMTRAEAIGKNIFDLLPQRMGKAIRERDLAVLGDEAGDTGPATVHFPASEKGGSVWLSMERHQFEEFQTKEPTIYTIATEVTDVIEAYDRTQAVLEKFRTLERLAGFGYWELDPRDKSVFWSDRVYELHGLSPADDPQKYEDALAFYHPDDMPMVSQAVEGIENAPGEFNFTARLQQASGDEVLVDVHGVALATSSGEVTKIVGTIDEAAEPDV